MSMESGPLSGDEFGDFASKVVLYLNVTSHVKTDADQDLLGAKGGSGFPYLVFLAADGKILAKHNYPRPRTADGFGETLEEAEAAVALRAKAAGGDADAVREVFGQDLEYGNLTAKEATAAVAGMKNLAAEDKARYDGLIANLEFREIMAGINKKAEELGDALTPDAIKGLQADAGKQFIAMWTAKRIPSGEQERRTFYVFLGIGGEAEKDSAALEASIEEMKTWPSNPNLAKRIAEAEAALKALGTK